MGDFLQTMAAASAERAERVPLLAAADFDRPLLPIAVEPFGIIAEIKDHSPAEGTLAGPGADRRERARQYAAGGAAAISVLTEPSRFAGDLSHLEDVVDAVPDTPVMRKDFLVAPVQVDEARAAGASGVLLIVAMLDDPGLRAMLDRAHEHGMFVLLESFDALDLDRAAAILNDDDASRIAEGQLLIGINTRNLRTLAVDADRLEALAPKLPAGRAVAESGLVTADDAERVAGWGYSMALVGTALMRTDDPASLVAAMREAGARGLSP